MKAIVARAQRPRVRAAMDDLFAEALACGDDPFVEPSEAALVVESGDSDGKEPRAEPPGVQPSAGQPTTPLKRKMNSEAEVMSQQKTRREKYGRGTNPATYAQLSCESSWLAENSTADSLRESHLATAFVSLPGKDQNKPASRVPIPVWPQYTMKWSGRQACDDIWILVGPREFWLMRMIDSLSNQDKRILAKRTAAVFRRGLKAPVWAIPRMAQTRSDQRSDRDWADGRIKHRGRRIVSNPCWH